MRTSAILICWSSVDNLALAAEVEVADIDATETVGITNLGDEGSGGLLDK